jgi:hypothetical protein
MNEFKAIELIQTSLDIEEPLNQEGMPAYYYEKNSYLKEAIKVLEAQIELYQRQSNSWSKALNGNGSNNMMEGGKKKKSGKSRKSRKSRKTKKVKRSKRV